MRALPSRFGGPDAPVFQTAMVKAYRHPRTVTDAFALARRKALSISRARSASTTCATRAPPGS